MRLLVSVRSAAEVRPALAGGAEIIDAKEPSRGSLASVSPDDLRAIAAALPRRTPLSVALGDPADAEAVACAIGALDGLVPPERAVYVKLGLASAAAVAEAEAVIVAAVRSAVRSPVRPVVIVVAYADVAAGSVSSRERVLELAARAGAGGILLDTCLKDGGDLLQYVKLPELERWAAGAERRGLLVGFAGSLSADGIRAVAELPADVVGVRGAACVGGRDGRLSEAKVRQLRAALIGPAGRAGAVA